MCSFSVDQITSTQNMARNRSKHNKNRAEHISAGNEKEDLNDIGRLDNDSNFSLHHRNSSGVKKGELADTSPLELPHEVPCKSIREELLPQPRRSIA